MEKIVSVDSAEFKAGLYGSMYEGYIIKTSKQEIKVGIESGQSCCENFGYLTTNDNLEDFVGANLLDIKIVNELLKPVDFLDSYESEAMFVNFYTSKGVMQLVVYNQHNGYYGHSAVLVSKQLNETTTL